MATNRSSTQWSREDRDLLIELKTEMNAVREDIRVLRDDLARRVQHMELNKLDKIEAEKAKADAQKDIDDLKKSVSNLQRYQIILSTLAGAAGAIITAGINLLSSGIFKL